MNDPRIEQAHLAYASLRRSQPDASPITVICIGPMQTLLVYGKGDTSAASVSLDIGTQKTSAEHFKHRPPTPGEMEVAVMSVEAEIARVPASLLAGSSLLTVDAAICEIALVAGRADQPVMYLGRAEVERTFDRLTYVIEGRPASSESLPESAELGATLLILREFMHHLGFSSITVAS